MHNQSKYLLLSTKWCCGQHAALAFLHFWGQENLPVLPTPTTCHRYLTLPSRENPQMLVIQQDRPLWSWTESLLLGCTGDSLCPVSAMLGYMAPNQGPLFIFHDGSPLSRNHLVTHCATCWQKPSELGWLLLQPEQALVPSSYKLGYIKIISIYQTPLENHWEGGARWSLG